MYCGWSREKYFYFNILIEMDFIADINQILCSSEEDEEGIERPVRVRRPYRMLARSTVDDYDDVDFRKYFRLSKPAFWHVHGAVRDVLGGDLRRSRELTAENKLLAALRMVACGNFQQTAGDYTGVSQQTVSKILPLVCDAILRHLPTYIRMPQTENERLAKASAFAEIAGFPRCIGAIDCTHVKIASMGGDISENFRNRHGYFSINVQTVSDADLRIMNVVARWPGSAHDSTIFNNCELRQQLERGEYGDYVIVGDGGYANTAYMCTPFRANVQLNRPQQLYQKFVFAFYFIRKLFELFSIFTGHKSQRVTSLNVPMVS